MCFFVRIFYIRTKHLCASQTVFLVFLLEVEFCLFILKTERGGDRWTRALLSTGSPAKHLEHLGVSQPKSDDDNSKRRESLGHHLPPSGGHNNIKLELRLMVELKPERSDLACSHLT